MGKYGSLLPTNTSGKTEKAFLQLHLGHSTAWCFQPHPDNRVLFLHPSFTLKVEEEAGGQRGSDEGDALNKHLCVEIGHDH